MLQAHLILLVWLTPCTTLPLFQCTNMLAKQCSCKMHSSEQHVYSKGVCSCRLATVLTPWHHVGYVFAYAVSQIQLSHRGVSDCKNALVLCRQSGGFWPMCLSTPRRFVLVHTWMAICFTMMKNTFLQLFGPVCSVTAYFDFNPKSILTA